MTLITECLNAGRGDNTRPQNKFNFLQRAHFWYNGYSEFSNNCATNKKILGTVVPEFQNPGILGGIAPFIF